MKLQLCGSSFRQKEITSNNSPQPAALQVWSSSVSHAAARTKLRPSGSNCRNPRHFIGQSKQLPGSSAQSFLSCMPPPFKRQEDIPEVARVNITDINSGGSEINQRYPHISINTCSPVTLFPSIYDSCSCYNTGLHRFHSFYSSNTVHSFNTSSLRIPIPISISPTTKVS